MPTAVFRAKSYAKVLNSIGHCTCSQGNISTKRKPEACTIMTSHWKAINQEADLMLLLNVCRYGGCQTWCW